MRFVVNAGIKAQLIHRKITFFSAARKAHHAATTRFGELPKHGAHRTTGGADGQRFARLGADDLRQTHPGSNARHAHRAQVSRQRDVRGVNLAHHAGHGGFHHGIFLPTPHADNSVAHAVSGVARRGHFTHRAALHHRI